MDLRDSESDEKFRAELRAWLAESVAAQGDPPAPNDWPARRAWDTGWQRKLFDAGYAGINWPLEYGGLEASLSEQLVYYEETARLQAPADGPPGEAEGPGDQNCSIDRRCPPSGRRTH